MHSHKYSTHVGTCDLTVLSRVSAFDLEADSQAPATFYLDDNDAPRKKPG